MKKYKKAILTVALAIAVASVSTTSAFANFDDGEFTVTKDITRPDKNYSSINVLGEANPTLATFTISISGKFLISPNMADPSKRFIAPTITLENDGPSPIDIHFNRIISQSGSPKVVAADKYTDAQWDKLGLTGTQNNIAFGLTGS